MLKIRQWEGEFYGIFNLDFEIVISMLLALKMIKIAYFFVSLVYLQQNMI